VFGDRITAGLEPPCGYNVANSDGCSQKIMLYCVIGTRIIELERMLLKSNFGSKLLPPTPAVSA
jgi:hypothetical protein